MGVGVAWTDVQDETLRDMAAKGYSTSEIARKLGGKTRCAVIGRAHRLRVELRFGQNKHPRPECAAPATAAEIEVRALAVVHPPKVRAIKVRPPKPAPQPRPAPMVIANDITINAKRLLSLGSRECRWPLGGKLDRPVWFCAAPVQAERSWCSVRCAIGYTRHVNEGAGAMAQRQKERREAGMAVGAFRI